MPITFDKSVNEKSTLGIEVTLTDENDVLIPQANIVSMTYTLTDQKGTVINFLQDVVVAAPDSTTVITLSGDDLQIIDERLEYEQRHFQADARVNTGLGTNLPISEAGYFKVINLRGKT